MLIHTTYIHKLYTFTFNINLHMHIQLTSFKLTPFLAVMVNPTGSIVGPGNTSLFNGDIQDALVCHAIVHDAFGYLHNFHRTGPGYNYLNVCDIVPATSPLSCQFQGWAAANKIGKNCGMFGTLGRRRRDEFMNLITQIPTIQNHRELEKTQICMRELLARTSSSFSHASVSPASTTSRSMLMDS